MQHSGDHSVVPTGRRAINTAIHRAQEPLILASEFLRGNGLEKKMKMMTRAEKEGERERDREKRGKEKKRRRDGEAKHRHGPQTLMLLREQLLRS